MTDTSLIRQQKGTVVDARSAIAKGADPMSEHAGVPRGVARRNRRGHGGGDPSVLDANYPPN